MSNPLPFWVYDYHNDEIKEWDLDDVVEFLNSTSDQLAFSINKEDVLEDQRLNQNVD